MHLKGTLVVGNSCRTQWVRKGPHEDQIAEMVLIWSSFYTKGIIFPIIMYHNEY